MTLLSILEAAHAAHAAGLCVLPVKGDGSKAPDLITWDEFKRRRPTSKELRAFDFGSAHGLGIVGGPVSAHVDTWDFDDHETFEQLVATADAVGLGDVVHRIRVGYEVRTPSGGRRWLVRYPDTLTFKDVALARRPGREGEKKIVTLIEITTFSVVAPSAGRTHPSGKPYEQASGGFDTIARYTADERDGLFALARSFDEMPKRPVAEPRTASSTTGTRPGDDYNRRMSWPQILEPLGWRIVYRRGATAYWRRPDKSHGVSASTNHGGRDALYVFSSSTEFDPEQSYSKFGAYALLNHRGDYAAAARALAAEGYGTPAAETTTPQDGPRKARTRSTLAFTRPAVLGTAGDTILAPLPTDPFSGWFARGAVHLIAGSSGAGKTTLSLDLFRTQRQGGVYLGHHGGQHDFVVVFADRGAVSNAETLARMRIDPATLPVIHLPATTSGAEAVSQLLTAVEALPDIPAAVFLEGADLLVEDPCKPQAVTSFVVALRHIAEHYALAIVLSVGAPKARPQEQYALQRDRVFGSQAWSRLSDTVLVLATTGDGTVASRELVVLHRNAAAEKFQLTFVDGLLVPSDPPATASETDMVAWFRDVERFTKQQFRNQFALSGTRATELLDGYVTVGTLRKRTRDDRTVYVVRQPDPPERRGLSVRGADTFVSPDGASESVRESDGHGHGNEAACVEKSNVCESQHAHSLIPPFSQSVVHFSRALQASTDENNASVGYTRARGAADSPSPVAVTEGTPPLAKAESTATTEVPIDGWF